MSEGTAVGRVTRRSRLLRVLSAVTARRIRFMAESLFERGRARGSRRRPARARPSASGRAPARSAPGSPSNPRVDAADVTPAAAHSGSLGAGPDAIARGSSAAAKPDEAGAGGATAAAGPDDGLIITARTTRGAARGRLRRSSAGPAVGPGSVTGQRGPIHPSRGRRRTVAAHRRVERLREVAAGREHQHRHGHLERTPATATSPRARERARPPA